MRWATTRLNDDDRNDEFRLDQERPHRNELEWRFQFPCQEFVRDAFALVFAPNKMTLLGKSVACLQTICPWTRDELLQPTERIDGQKKTEEE